MCEWRKGVGKGELYASLFLYLECILTDSEENRESCPYLEFVSLYEHTIFLL